MSAFRLLIPATVAVALAACGGDGGSADISGTGFVSLGVTL